jgi:hypothetical protein
LAVNKHLHGVGVFDQKKPLKKTTQNTQRTKNGNQFLVLAVRFFFLFLISVSTRLCFMEKAKPQRSRNDAIARKQFLNRMVTGSGEEIAAEAAEQR